MAKIAVLAQKRPFLDPKKDQKGKNPKIWPQMVFLAPKRAIFGPKKGTKSAKIDFLLKLHFLHILVKFKQKIAKKIQKYG